MLPFYSERFRTVEVNNTFYRMPKSHVLAAWREATPPGFVFAVKASRFITHMKKLKDADAPVAQFLAAVDSLGAKRGPVLFQLPPRWRCDTGRFERFLDALPEGNRYAFEFRDPTWDRQEVYEALRERGAAHCIYQLAGRVSGREVTADFVYIRLHGPGDAYKGQYGPGELRGWADSISTWTQQGLDVYCYFDNDENGYAAGDALRLREMLGGGGGCRCTTRTSRVP